MNEDVKKILFEGILIVLAVIFFMLACTACTYREPVEVEKTEQNAKYEPTDVQKAEAVITTLKSVVKEAPEMAAEPVVKQDAEVVEYPKLYTHADVIAMAKLLYGEARGVEDLYVWDGRVISSEYQRACVIWSVLNRYDAGWEDSIIDVIAAYKQFHGYDEDHPVEEEFVILAYDVLERWNREQHGETNVGRVLPAEYVYFYGDMKNNYFLEEYKDRDEYNWDLDDPYN